MAWRLVKQGLYLYLTSE